MSKKKKKTKTEVTQIHTRFPDFSPQFKADLGWWYKTELGKVDKIFRAVKNPLMSVD